MSTEQSTETGPICADCGGSEGKMFETSDDRGMRHVDLTACIRHLRFLRDADAKRATEQTHHAVARLNIAARDRGEIQDRLTALYERLGEAEDEIADIQLTSGPWYVRIVGLEKRLDECAQETTSLRNAVCLHGVCVDPPARTESEPLAEPTPEPPTPCDETIKAGDRVFDPMFKHPGTVLDVDRLLVEQAPWRIHVKGDDGRRRLYWHPSSLSPLCEEQTTTTDGPQIAVQAAAKSEAAKCDDGPNAEEADAYAAAELDALRAIAANAPEPEEPEYAVWSEEGDRWAVGRLRHGQVGDFARASLAENIAAMLNTETARVRREEQAKAAVHELSVLTTQREISRRALDGKEEAIDRLNRDNAAAHRRADEAIAEVSRLREQWRNRPLAVGDRVRLHPLDVPYMPVTVTGTDRRSVCVTEFGWRSQDSVERIEDDFPPPPRYRAEQNPSTGNWQLRLGRVVVSDRGWSRATVEDFAKDLNAAAVAGEEKE